MAAPGENTGSEETSLLSGGWGVQRAPSWGDEEVRLPGGQSRAATECGQDPWWPRIIILGPCWHPTAPLSEERVWWWRPCPSFCWPNVQAGTAASQTLGHSPYCSRGSRRGWWDPQVAAASEREADKNPCMPPRRGRLCRALRCPPCRRGGPDLSRLSPSHSPIRSSVSGARAQRRGPTGAQ